MSHIKPRLKPVYAHFRRVIHTAKTSAAKACENGAGNGSKTERKKGRKTGLKKEWRPGRETGLQDGRKRAKKGTENGARKRTGNGSEKLRGTEAKRSKNRARQNGGAFRKMLRGETLSGVLGRGKRIFPTDGKRKRVRIAPKPCRNARSEYRVRRNGTKVSEIAFSHHKNGAEGETDRKGDEIKRRNGKNEGIRRQRAKNGGKTDLRTHSGVCEEKGTRPRIYNYGNQSVQSGRNGC